MYILYYIPQEVIAVFIFSLLWGRQCRLIFLARNARGTFSQGDGSLGCFLFYDSAKGTVLLAAKGTVLLAAFDCMTFPIFSLDIPVNRANCLIEHPFS